MFVIFISVIAVAIGLIFLSRQKRNDVQIKIESAGDASSQVPSGKCEIKTLRVFYGTQTGTAKKFAVLLADEAQGSFATETVNLKDFDPEKHVLQEVDGQIAFVYVVSTYTNGEPPDVAKWFYQWLQESVNDFRVPRTLLRGHRFAVFGLGNSLYQDHYNTVSQNISQWLLDLGASPLLPRGEGDENVAGSKHGGTEADFEAWKSSLFESLKTGNEDKGCACNEGGTCQTANQKIKTGDQSSERNKSEREDDGLDSDLEDDGETDVIDVEDLGAVMSRMKNAQTVNGIHKNSEPKEMVTPTIRKNLTKQGYRIIGSHSGVKLCRWTKSMLRGRGGCYKHTFYGIESHRCMETTPSLACANKCVFCWRHHTNPVGTEWRWQMDDAESIVEGALQNHYNMIKQFKGVPGVKPERMGEAMKVQHCALSLVGEPIMYPKINRLVQLLHKERISSFLVTNAQFPDAIKNLVPVTQLYVSVDASTKESLKKVDRPLFRDFWPRFLESLKALSDKGQRTVYRLTLVKSWNDEEIQSYAELIELGKPDFIEVKGVTYCGESKASTLTMQNVPWHEEVVFFMKKLMDLLPSYEIACEHEHSNCVLAANTKFKKDGEWWTWIDYPQFHALMAEYEASNGERLFSSEDYMARTPSWAVYGSKEQGFDPEETRFFRKGKKKDLSGC
ncbi:S-adenosyl-L-methionine-dependent tRNA 4-demethylwyosine synthase TYW1-like [Diadema antillarum]|uniref:S-adenosyl-L-methionine-dependent tRNA 4-demethylwyosine synthase TYW1-like n=1 Tax=Diadema antillarum TaxID=105358 RepID=UPI003A89B2C2